MNSNCNSEKDLIYGEISRRYWKTITSCADRRQILFHLEPKEAWKIFLSQNKSCAITGLPLEMISLGYRGNASLDRIDSSKAYAKNNVQWVLSDINIMKKSHNINYFKYLCEKVCNPSV
jgi:hypothetical protein